MDSNIISLFEFRDKKAVETAARLQVAELDNCRIAEAQVSLLIDVANHYTYSVDGERHSIEH